MTIINFGVKHLRWEWLEMMAETGRRQLEPGERRVGRYKHHNDYPFIVKEANDQIIKEVVEERGHAILVAAIEHLQSLSPDRPVEDILLCFTRLLEHQHNKRNRYKPITVWSVGRHRMTTKECQDAAAALSHVFQSTEVGALYTAELMADEMASLNSKGWGQTKRDGERNIGKIVDSVIFDVSYAFTNPLFPLLFSM
jgi:hypothetical protein